MINNTNRDGNKKLLKVVTKHILPVMAITWESICYCMIGTICCCNYARGHTIG